MKPATFLSLRLLGGLCLLMISSWAQQAAIPTTQEQVPRPMLEKLGAKARQYRENHASLLRIVTSQSQLFKGDLVTPKGKPWSFEGRP